MNSASQLEPIPCSITPDQELSIIKLILDLRSLGDVEASEKVRRRVREALLKSADDTAAMAKVEEILRRGKRTQSKLDGSYEERQRRKRERREQDRAAASRLVDIEAGSGEDSEGSASAEEDNEPE
ncbi:hypothetical protein ABB37_02217 [Leptomonas pyrrhocoris]|uniref:Uncharacterized protein n=1 Tax=Leptomonas pyrrhocoris TaxID=157538 RepID=A0A0N0VGS0_LEPPY|nr:hypothetical protein ABB37_02217 [Leptomonas pyrrhocoris]XP_015662573.1 hypothetical protein ABB37_02217 [Leptomonas pyrrhocoris]KPA84133.1 hypothetical protein ABB37_02217 [Leptomonas pyrrhocoris]KPA84134.1 hypothetical protein ABB37_02217 [Leptomonas pyrrhocoris]|eukprot:XP_015662572.1 hypothetical protein ABB37_02217 [Leptomonas pyrrhocoris]